MCWCTSNHSPLHPLEVVEEAEKVEDRSALSALDIVVPFVFVFLELFMLVEGGEIVEDEDEDVDEVGVSIHDMPVHASLE